MLGEDLYDNVKEAMLREGMEWPAWLDLKPDERRAWMQAEEDALEAFRGEHPVFL